MSSGTDKNINVAVIGTGIFAKQKHLPAINLVDGLKITGCYNRTKAKAESFASQAGDVKVYDSIEAILEDPGIHSIDALLPVDQNLRIVKQAIGASKPICIEKPIAATLEDAAEIVKLAESTSIPVMILENWCYHHGVFKLKELLPKIGAVSHFALQASGPFRLSAYHETSWRQRPKHIGGFLSDAGVHDLSLLTEVLGNIEAISARSKQVREESGTVDTLSSLVHLSNGTFGTYTQSRYSGACEPTLQLQIFGSAGSLVYSRPTPAGGTITVWEGSDSSNSNSYRIDTPEDLHNGVVAEFQNWAEVLRSNDKSKLVSTPRKAFHHYAAIAAAVESAGKNGAKVKVLSV